MNIDYVLDSQSNVWMRADGGSLEYSDGDDVERGLLDNIEKATDISSVSRELASAIVDWPTKYHLSNVRHNLLRPFGIGPGHRVLELGCGCGALTRYLGESGAEVVAVEGSVRRAKIAAARCRDMPNVRIYCNNLIDFTSADKFDFVLLIGVLEYAPKFVEGSDPVGRSLNHAREFLKEDGALLLAIENQLGLKYLNGCAEDHIGIPFYGICDLYGKNEPTTFGRHELSRKLTQSGFENQQFFFPFPDYKLPNLIVSSVAADHAEFRLEELLFRNVGTHCGEVGLHSFFEPLAWRAIVRNGLFADMSHSFLVLATTSASCRHAPGRDWLASHYSSERLPDFATETAFRDGGCGMRVEKKLLYPNHARTEVPMHGGRLIHRPAKDEPYLSGRLYACELQKLLARGAGVDAIANWASDWVRLLVKAAHFDTGRAMLAGEWLDAIPANFIRGADGALTRFDEEWSFAGEIPLSWVVVRGLVNSIAVCPTSPAISGLSFRRVIDATLERVLFPEHFNEADYVTAALWETDLMRNVYGGSRSVITYMLYSEPAKCSIAGQNWQEKLICHEAEIARVKSTVSWHVTKPLRFFGNLAKNLMWHNAR